jgi:hypothetical protein
MSTPRRDPSEHAEAHYRDALAIAQELGMRPLVAHCHLGLGKLYRRAGTREQAQGHLSVAVTVYREMDMTYRLNQSESVGA